MCNSGIYTFMYTSSTFIRFKAHSLRKRGIREKEKERETGEGRRGREKERDRDRNRYHA